MVHYIIHRSRASIKEQEKSMEKQAGFHQGAFYLHLLELFFVYQFYSRVTTLVESTSQNPVEIFVFMSFHNHLKLF